MKTNSGPSGVAARVSAAEAAWRRAVRWLAAYDRSSHEIRIRLEDLGTAPRVVAATLRRLQELHYVDDERLARAAAETAARRGHGSERVRAELAGKGVAEALIDTAIEATFADENGLARRILGRRFPTPPGHASERAKAARFLLQRGFPEAVVLAIMGEGC